MEYSQAKKIADRIVEIFTPHCELIHIAGSVRRHRYQVKDIEIVCQPKEVFIQSGLFGDGEYLRVKEFKDAISKVSQKIIKGKPEGRYMQVELKGPGEIKLDIFMPLKEDYYRQLAIRTGSKDYAHKMIAGGWLKMGWCGTDDDGLRKQSDCIGKKGADDKIHWRLVNKNGEKPPIWQSEQDFFNWLGVRYVEPSDRELEKSKHSFLAR